MNGTDAVPTLANGATDWIAWSAMPVRPPHQPGCPLIEDEGECTCGGRQRAHAGAEEATCANVDQCGFRIVGAHAGGRMANHAKRCNQVSAKLRRAFAEVAEGDNRWGRARQLLATGWGRR